uniref:Sushi domain-containing protein n=1 Tax=Salvator merianae TaxID=96440 RepID=A0A8D0BFD1_SALMN
TFTALRCPPPPRILHGKHIGEDFTYRNGQYVNYSCDPGYVLRGPSSIYCTTSGEWSFPVPHCDVACKDPVVEHGIKLSGLQTAYKYGSNVTFECKIGYFMIGSYFIQCSKNSTWYPEIPSCKKSNKYNVNFKSLTKCFSRCSICIIEIPSSHYTFINLLFQFYLQM